MLPTPQKSPFHGSTLLESEIFISHELWNLILERGSIKGQYVCLEITTLHMCLLLSVSLDI